MCGQQAAQSFQRSGFTRTVSADQAHGFTLLHLEANVFNGADTVVIDAQVLHGKQAHATTSPPK